jgi:acyl-coenzyme A thioesterase PaaI-like protein
VSSNERAVAASGGGAGRRLARLNTACVVCGPENPAGLRLNFNCSPDEATAEWRPTRAWESFQGVIHGGIVTAVLDEAMSKAIIARHCEALTAELRVRFRRRVSPGAGVLRVRGWVVERRKRRILAEAALTSPSGEEYAHAWAAFLILPGASAHEMVERPPAG